MLRRDLLKRNNISSAGTFNEEDTIKDIIGYCLLELYYRQYGGRDGVDKDKGWQE